MNRNGSMCGLRMVCDGVCRRNVKKCKENKCKYTVTRTRPGVIIFVDRAGILMFSA